MTAQVLNPTLSRVMKPHPADWQSTSCTVAERFQKLFELAEWADCKFLVGADEPRTEFLCHKLVLAASSPVFEALFYGSLAIKHEEPVILPDMDAEHFQLFIKYLYTDFLIIPDISTAQGILYAAKKYLIPHLAKRCTRYLEQNLTIDDLCDTLRVAECLRENQLRKQCLKMMCHTNTLQWWISDLKTKGSSLSASSMSILLDTMPLPDKELDVFSLLLEWAQASCAEHNLESSASQHRLLLNQSDLLGRVRFLRMTREDFAQVKATGILTPEEAELLEASIVCLETQRIAYSSLRTVLSLGFCLKTVPRSVPLTKEQPYMRRVIRTNKMAWLYGNAGAKVHCSFQSHYTLFVTGFRMYTRLPSTEDYNVYVKRKSKHTYEEKLKVLIKDNDERVISSFNYHNSQVQYHSSINIELKEPFWTKSKQSYHIIVELERGQYPAQELENVVLKGQDRIEFEEKSTQIMRHLVEPGHEEVYTETLFRGLIVALLCKKCLPDETSFALKDD